MDGTEGTRRPPSMAARGHLEQGHEASVTDASPTYAPPGTRRATGAGLRFRVLCGRRCFSALYERRQRSVRCQCRETSHRHDVSSLGGERVVDRDQGVGVELAHGEVLGIEGRIPPVLARDPPCGSARHPVAK